MQFDIKRVTCNTIWFGDLEQLIGEKLGVPVRKPGGMAKDGEYEFAVDRDYPSNGTYMIIDPETDHNKCQYSKTYEYVFRLFDGGFLPVDAPLFIDIWW